MKSSFKGKSLGIVAAVFVLLIFLHSLDILNPLERVIFRILSPVQSYFYNTGLKTRVTIDKFRIKNNESELELLKTQVRSLLVQNARLKILAEENKILKKELDFSRTHDFETIGARVIGLDTMKNSTLIILQVEKENFDLSELRKNMPVIIEDGIFIGKIYLIKEDKIFMLPATASESAVAATVLNKDYTLGVAEGELNLGIKMRMIPKNELMKQGELVVTSGLEAEVPQGLLLGTISKVTEDPQNPFTIAHISPLYDAKRLSKVLIIKNY